MKVYRVYALMLGGVVQYIGCTSDVAEREKWHRFARKRKFDRLEVLEIHWDKKRALSRERRLIRLRKPPLNQMGLESYRRALAVSVRQTDA